MLVPPFLQKPVREGAVNGPTVSHFAAELLGLSHVTCQTGLITCGLKCTPRRRRDGFIVILVRTRAINHFFMRLAGGRNFLTSQHFHMNRSVNSITRLKNAETETSRKISNFALLNTEKPGERAEARPTRFRLTVHTTVTGFCSRTQKLQR